MIRSLDEYRARLAQYAWAEQNRQARRDAASVSSEKEDPALTYGVEQDVEGTRRFQVTESAAFPDERHIPTVVLRTFTREAATAIAAILSMDEAAQKAAKGETT